MACRGDACVHALTMTAPATVFLRWSSGGNGTKQKKTTRNGYRKSDTLQQLYKNNDGKTNEGLQEKARAVGGQKPTSTKPARAHMERRRLHAKPTRNKDLAAFPSRPSHITHIHHQPEGKANRLSPLTARPPPWPPPAWWLWRAPPPPPPPPAAAPPRPPPAFGTGTAPRPTPPRR